MLNKKELNLLAKYLSSECSVDEEERVEKWGELDKKNQKIVEILKTFWNKKKIPPKKSDVNKCWKEVAEKAGITPGIVQQGKVPGGKIIQFPIRRRYKLAMRYAALLLLIFLLPFVWKTVKTSFFTSQTYELKEIIVKNGEKMNLTLPDKSKVVLDSGTLFRYPSHFNSETREVFLDGEGYFEIYSNLQKPFIVHANHAVIRVVGTKFNIRAWRATQKVKVAVTEGKVSLYSEKAGNNGKVIISKGEMSVLQKKGGPSKPFQTDVSKELSWINREMAFENVSLFEILKQLERWYNIRFVLADADDDDISAFDSLTVNIEDEPLEDILELIATLTGLNYRREGNIVYLSSGSNSGQLKNPGKVVL